MIQTVCRNARQRLDSNSLILVRFPDADFERRALAFLAGRFAFKTWDSGDLLVPDAALSHLAHAGIKFQVQGPAPYEQNIPTFRDPAATAV